MNEYYETKREAGDKLIREGADELEEYGYCEDCNKMDEADAHQEVLEKIDRMIEHKKRMQQAYLDTPERDDRYLRYSLLQEQIRALKELREELW
ncbi:hypothetical protein ES705_36405 [subsurface metagenome]